MELKFWILLSSSLICFAQPPPGENDSPALEPPPVDVPPPGNDSPGFLEPPPVDVPPPDVGQPPPDQGGPPPGGEPPPDGGLPPDLGGQPLGGEPPFVDVPPPFGLDPFQTTDVDLTTYCKTREVVGTVALIHAAYPSDATFKAFNINATSGEGWVDTWQPNNKCYRLIFLLIVVEEKKQDLLAMYDKNILMKLERAHFLVGEDIPSVERWASHTKKLYIATAPLPLFHEKLLDDTIVNVWPSPTVFISAITLNARLLLPNVDRQRILILTYGETVDLIEYVDEIKTRLEVDNNDRVVEVFGLTKEFSGGTSNLPLADKTYQSLSKLRRKLEGIHLVITYFEASIERKVEVLNLLFMKGADLEDESRPWLIADMQFPYEKMALESFEMISVLKTPVYMLWPDMGTDYSMIEFDQKCSMGNTPGMGVNYQGMLRTKYIIEKVYTNLTENFDMVTLLERVSAYVQERDAAADESMADTLDVAQYPKDVLFRVMQMKPLITVVESLKLRPFATPARVTDLRKCGILKSVYGLKPTLNQYSSKGDIEEQEKGVMRDKNYWLMGIEGARGVDEEDEGPPLAVMIEDEPFVVKKADDYRGIAAELFRAALNEMTREGIIVRFRYIDADSYGTKINGTWSGVFGLLKEKKSAKIGVGQISLTPDRLAEFDFTPAFGYSYRTYMLKKSLLHEHYSFVRPFTAEVWGYLFLVMLASAVVIFIFDAWNPFKDEIPEGSEFTPGESLWHSYLILTQLGAPFGCHIYPSRVFSLFYWFFALVVVGCYTGNLASFLTTSQYAPIKVDLNEMIEDDLPYGIVGNTSVQSMFKRDMMDIPTELYEKVMRGGIIFDSYSEGIEQVREKNVLLFGTSSVLTYHVNNDPECALAMQRESFYSRNFEELAFVIKPDWEHAEAFKRAMRRVKESGMLNNIYSRYLNFHAECSVEEDDHAPMGISNFYGLLTFLAISIVASFIVLSFKLFYYKLRDDLYLPEVFKNELRAEFGLSHRPAEECTNDARRRRNKNLRGKDLKKSSPRKTIPEAKENGTGNGILNDVDYIRAPNAVEEDIDLDDYDEDFV